MKLEPGLVVIAKGPPLVTSDSQAYSKVPELPR